MSDVIERQVAIPQPGRICANCDTAIGSLEKAETWREQTVCWSCYLVLLKQYEPRGPEAAPRREWPLTGAAYGGAMCVLVGCAMMIFMPLLAPFSLVLFLTAFICGIVAMAQGRPGTGLLFSSFRIFPCQSGPSLAGLGRVENPPSIGSSGNA